MDMWLSSENLSCWTVSSHKDWEKNTSNETVLHILNQKIAKYEKDFEEVLLFLKQIQANVFLYDEVVFFLIKWIYSYNAILIIQ